MTEIKEVKLHPLHIYGLQGNAFIPLATFNLLDAEKREEVVLELLDKLSSSEVVIMGNSLIRTDSYDGFRVV